MAVRDIVGLGVGILTAIRDGFGGALQVLENYLRTGSIIGLAKDVNAALPGKTELSGDEIAKAPGQVIEGITAALEKNKIPAFIAYPIIATVSIAAGLRTIMMITETTAERNVLQPLRKTIRPALLDQSTAVEGWLRGLVSDDDLKDVLARIGFKDKDITLLKGLTRYVVGAQDIVQFAVREAYNPGTVSKFQMDQGLNEVLAATKDDRAKAGLDDGTFSKFWLSHWELPSILQGFEAFQRGLITQADLDTLLVAKDVMPFWRGVLTKMSYNVLTRVDARRMHKLGLLSEADLTKEHMRMGYSPEDAARLTKFVVADNADPIETEQTETDKFIQRERDLTKADILGAFKDSLFTADEAKEQLKQIGYSDIEVDLLLSRISAQKDADYANDLVKTYGALYVKGLQSWKETEANLQKIPLAADHIAQLERLWDLDRVEKVDLPSKAEILRFRKKGIIDDGLATQLLLTINVPAEHIAWYFKDTE